MSRKRLTKDAALRLYAEIAGIVGRISEAERAAVETLERSSAG